MSARAQAVMAPLLPQVNLLPPEVTAARGLARTKRWLALVVVLALVAAVGLVGKAILDQRDADEQLANARADTQRLLAQQAQYAEVPIAQAALERARSARALGMSTEVFWRPYFDAINAVRPEGWRIEEMKAVSATPMLLAQAPVDVLTDQGATIITFTAQASVVPDISAWLRGLARIPNFTDAWFSDAMLKDDQGTAMYQVTGTVVLSFDAYEERYSLETLAAAEAAAAEEEAAEGAGTDEGAEDGDATEGED